MLDQSNYLEIVLQENRLKRLGEILTENLSRSDSFSIFDNSENITIQVYTKEPERLLGILKTEDFEVNQRNEGLLIPESWESENPIINTAKNISFSGATLKGIYGSRFPVMPSLGSQLPAESGKGLEKDRGVVIVENCEDFKIVKSDTTEYTEGVIGTATSAEIEQAVQKAYAKGIQEASKFIPKPNDWRDCTKPCFPIYTIVFGVVNRQNKAVVSGSAKLAVPIVGSLTGSLTIDAGPILTDIKVEFEWSVLMACVKKVDEDKEEEQEEGSSNDPTILLPGGRAGKVKCPDHFNNGRETAKFEFLLKRPMGEMSRNWNEGNWELKAVKPEVQKVIRKAAEKAAEALKNLQECGPPCGLEQVITIIGPINVTYGVVSRGINWKHEAIISVDWYIRRKCR